MRIKLLLRAALAPIAVTFAVAGASGPFGEPAPARTRRQAERGLMTRITIDLREQTISDTIDFLAGAAGLEADAAWSTDASIGLDADATISLRLRNVTVLEGLERALDAIGADDVDEPTWQLAADGVLEIGPRSRLNRHRRVETYAIADLVRATPDFPDAPNIDLGAALRPDTGAIFQEERAGPSMTPAEVAETPAERLARLITTLIEPAQWSENGGQGATIHILNDTLVIDAPEYIHRQIAGTMPG
jgi:hypothetical protein